jgi:large subunit ribosomal protein L13
MSTYFLKHKDLDKKWVLIDASNLVLGRLSSEIARILKGKHKSTYTPHMDCGDYVVVINASKVALTGKKANPKDGKIYYRHTGFPGGIKDITAGKILASKYPERVIKKAVERMLTRNTQGRMLMSHLYVYGDDAHPHQGQQPELYDFGSKNRKNVKSTVNA